MKKIKKMLKEEDIDLENVKQILIKQTNNTAKDNKISLIKLTSENKSDKQKPVNKKFNILIEVTNKTI